MAIAFVKALQAAGATGTSSSSTIAVTTTGSVAAGNTIIGLVVSRLIANVTLLSVSGGSLGWTVDATIAGGTGQNEGMGLFSAYCPAGLATSTVITATLSAATTRQAMALFEFSGIAGANAAYGAHTGNGTAANPTTVASMTNLIVGDLVVGGMQLNNSGTTQALTAGTGFTIPASGGDTLAGSSSVCEGALEYMIATGATQSVTYACTIATAWAGAGVAYRVATPGLVAPRTSMTPMRAAYR